MAGISLRLSIPYNRVGRFGLGGMFKRVERSVPLKKNLFPQRDSRQPVTRESTRHEFVLFYDICRRLIFSANRLSASKWSSQRNEEGCRARGFVRGGRRIAEGVRKRGRGIDKDRGRKRQTVAAYLRIRGNWKEKKRKAKGGGRHISRLASTYLCSFCNGRTPAMRSDVYT